ncbi:MAG: helix-turn-helix domain-containing protein [Legionellales bacterium]|nr:helix-turn-helix domain-containing protein [Legionellales bacterium]
MSSENNTQEFDLLTQKEAAAMIRMSEAWFERQRWEHKGIPYIKIGGRVFYDKEDLVKWVKKQKSKPENG